MKSNKFKRFFKRLVKGMKWKKERFKVSNGGGVSKLLTAIESKQGESIGIALEKRETVCSMDRESWVCKSGELGGWYVWQCNNCWEYIHERFILTRKKRIDKRIKRCPCCNAKIIHWGVVS